MSKRIGRPPADNPKSERLFIRVTPSEKEEIQSHSKRVGLSLLDLLKKGVEATKK